MKNKPPAPLPPAYVELVKTLIQLIQRWCGEQPGLPDLRWLDPGDTMFVGSLGSPAVKFLADSPDAFRLLAWLDEQTGREATVFQATVALRMLGHLPGGPGVGAIKESAGMRNLEAFAHETGTDTRHAAIACPHCGKGLDGASGLEGHVPRPGDLGLCVYCLGVHEFGEGTFRALSEADLDALAVDNPDSIAAVREMQALMRASKLKKLTGKRGVEA
jgi:hypothetical protein